MERTRADSEQRKLSNQVERNQAVAIAVPHRLCEASERRQREGWQRGTHPRNRTTRDGQLEQDQRQEQNGQTEQHPKRESCSAGNAALQARTGPPRIDQKCESDKACTKCCSPGGRPDCHPRSPHTAEGETPQQSARCQPSGSNEGWAPNRGDDPEW